MAKTTPASTTATTKDTPEISEDVQQNELLGMVVAFMSSARSVRYTLEDNWGNWYRSYLGDNREAGADKTYDLDPGIQHQHTETILAAMVELLFGAGDFYELTPDDSNDVEKAEVWKIVMDKLLSKMKFKRRIKEGLRDATTMGTNHWKLMWRQSRGRDVTRRNKETGLPEKTTEYLYDAPDVISTSLPDVFIDPTLDPMNFADASILIHWYVKTEGELMAMAKGKKDMKEEYMLAALKRVDSTKSKDTDLHPQAKFHTNSAEDAGAQYMGMNTRPQTPGKKYSVFETWTWLMLPGEGDDKEVKMRPALVICLGKESDSRNAVAEAVAHKGRNPRWSQRHPFVSGQFLPTKGSAYGRGVCAINKDLVVASRDFLNLTIKNLRLVCDNMWVALGKAMITQEKIESEPGKVIQIGGTDLSAFKPMTVPPVIDAGLAGMNVVSEIAKKNDGAQDTIAGVALSKDATATAVGTERNAATRRIGSVALDFEGDVILPLLEMLISMVEELVIEDRDLFIRLAGEKGLQYDTDQWPQCVLGSFDITVHGVATAEQMARRIAKFMQLLDIIKDLPPEQSGVELAKLIKVIWEKGFGEKDWNSFSVEGSEGVSDGDPVSFTEENRGLDQNQDLPVHLDDNHDDHITGHSTDPITPAKETHVGRHLAAKHFTEMQALDQGPGAGPTAPAGPGGLGDSLPGAELPAGPGESDVGLAGREAAATAPGGTGIPASMIDVDTFQ